MKMVPADFVSDDDKEIRRILNKYPLLKGRVTRLINGYRELIAMLIEDEDNRADPVDIVRSCAKKENVMSRIGIPILNTPQEWDQFFREERGERS